MDGIEFFETYSHLGPRNYAPAGTGRCPCNREDVELFANGPRVFCKIGVLLRQTYPHGENENRLQMRSYMLITPASVRYWGNFKLQQVSSKIVCSEAHDIHLVKRQMLLDPPAPPWMFVSFSRSNECMRLHLTTSNDTLWFSGETTFFDPTVLIERIDRRQVVAIHSLGLTYQDWRKFLKAQQECAMGGKPKALAVLRESFKKCPGLRDIIVPPARSPEAIAVDFLLRTDGATQ